MRRAAGQRPSPGRATAPAAAPARPASQGRPARRPGRRIARGGPSGENAVSGVVILRRCRQVGRRARPPVGLERGRQGGERALERLRIGLPRGGAGSAARAGEDRRRAGEDRQLVPAPHRRRTAAGGGGQAQPGQATPLRHASKIGGSCRRRPGQRPPCLAGARGSSPAASARRGQHQARLGVMAGHPAARGPPARAEQLGRPEPARRGARMSSGSGSDGQRADTPAGARGAERSGAPRPAEQPAGQAPRLGPKREPLGRGEVERRRIAPDLADHAAEAGRAQALLQRPEHVHRPRDREVEKLEARRQPGEARPPASRRDSRSCTHSTGPRTAARCASTNPVGPPSTAVIGEDLGQGRLLPRLPMRRGAVRQGTGQGRGGETESTARDPRRLGCSGNVLVRVAPPVKPP